MIYLSSVYFGCRGKSVYGTVKKAHELGFDGVEIRQEHLPSKNVLGELKKIKSSFPDLGFTIHAPLWNGKGIQYLNTAMGLTGKNRRVLNDLFKGAEILEAENVLFHPGFREVLAFNKVLWFPRTHSPRLKMPRGIAEKRHKQFLEKAVEMAGNIGANVVIENPAPGSIDYLLKSKEEFEMLFSKMPELGFVLDISHSLANKKLDDFLKLGSKIQEVHVSYTNTDEDLHLPINLEQLQPLKPIPKIKNIPLVLEHSENANLKELIQETETVEKFLKSV